MPRIHRLRSRRPLRLVSVDIACWMLAYVSLLGYRLLDQGVFGSYPWYYAAGLAVLSAGVHLCIAWFQRLHHGRSMTGSFEEMVSLAKIVFAVGAVVTLINLFFVWVPRSVPPAATVTALVLMASARGGYRAWSEAKLVGSGVSAVAMRVLVVGAGDAGRQLVRSMLRDPDHRWLPVGIIDDDPTAGVGDPCGRGGRGLDASGLIRKVIDNGPRRMYVS